MSTQSTTSSASESFPSANNDERGLNDGILGGACDVSQITHDRTHQNEFDDGLHPALSQESSGEDNDNFDDVSSQFIVQRLKDLYHNHVLHAEKEYHLHFNFCLPTDGEIRDSEFDATPMVLLIGQYSTGKVKFSISNNLQLRFGGYY